MTPMAPLMGPEKAPAMRPEAKPGARAAILDADLDWARVVIRINPVDTPFRADDLDLRLRSNLGQRLASGVADFDLAGHQWC